MESEEGGEKDEREERGKEFVTEVKKAKRKGENIDKNMRKNGWRNSSRRKRSLKKE